DEAARPDSAAETSARALAAARAGQWSRAAALYGEAVVLEPERASLHACRLRAEWRARRGRRFDVEGLDDGGEALVQAR
ncbi:MAG TPA: hypothetical protein VFO85_19175, partial [Vicinamibacteria bacterium]|nr:hypothetical protein [Vicinamibacteria bacterium]